MERIIRLEEIELQHFKNVSYGDVTIANDVPGYESSFLGIYGQNGSGKTALIDALELLKRALCGRKIQPQYADYIQVGRDCAKLVFHFSVRVEQYRYKAVYGFSLAVEHSSDDEENTGINSGVSSLVPTIKDEYLSFSLKGGKKDYIFQKLMSTMGTDTLLPANKRKELIGDEKEAYTNLLVNKRVAYAESRSFLFSRELLSQIRKSCDVDEYKKLIEALVRYGNFDLFVINKTDSGIISLNALPLNFSFIDKKNRHSYFGSLAVNLNEPTVVPIEEYDLVEKVIEGMNIVLNQLIPGLTIGVKDLGRQLDDKGNERERLQLVSCKNEKEIPLKYESDGIKKIISVLDLLIAVYNHSSITVAVDELDAGIFEYLLGEVLKIISENGKGQLIFTSHNLRPLETLNKNFVAFTTTNPKHRYIRLTNVKKTNNLRDFYYRDIQLGEQAEEVYNATNNFDIALAFKEAGDTFGS